MRRIISLSLFALLIPSATAQRRGGFAVPAARGSFAPSYPRSPFHYPRTYGYASGYGYVPYEDAAPYTYTPPPVILMQPPEPVEPPPLPAHAVITNYNVPDSPPPSPTSAAQTFAIVLKDGSTLAATTIVASADGLHVVDPDDRHLRLSMAAVDRAATLKLNRERNLSLYLPAQQ